MLNSRDLKDTFRLVRPWKHNFGPNDEWSKGWNECIKQLRKNEDKLIRTVVAIEREFIETVESQNNDLKG